jgi:hypothetical protein
MRLLFQVGSRTISGSLAGKFLQCTMRPPQGGTLPPAGDYAILAPMNDPIYGRVALMVPVGGSGAVDVGLTLQKCLVAIKLTFKPDAGPSPVAFGVAKKPGGTAAGDVSQVFVLSDKPVLGRNCIVVSSGFADLMDGLQTAGGARVTLV